MTSKEDENSLAWVLIRMGAVMAKDREGNMVAIIDATVGNGEVRIDERSFVNVRECRFNPVLTGKAETGENEITLFSIDAFITKLFELGTTVTEDENDRISVIFTEEDGICANAGIIIGPEGGINPKKYGYEIDEIKRGLIILCPL